MHVVSMARQQRRMLTRSMKPSDNGLLANETGLSENEQFMYKTVNRMVSNGAKQLIFQHLSTGGKRIRARLALATIEAIELSNRALKPIRHLIDSQGDDHEQHRTVLGMANQIVLAETPC
ncbi:MAG: hypothetical protein JXA30_22685 [Deltaproteobacteria bacterium]|nr:hypothetical protein [Deltaproteobacteria bacterium]